MKSIFGNKSTAALSLACAAFLSACGGGGMGSWETYTSTCIPGPCPPDPVINSLAKYVGKWQFCNGEGKLDTFTVTSANGFVVFTSSRVTADGMAINTLLKRDIYVNNDCTGAWVGSLTESTPSNLVSYDWAVIQAKTTMTYDLGPLLNPSPQFKQDIDMVQQGMAPGYKYPGYRFIAEGPGMTSGPDPRSSIGQIQYCFQRDASKKYCETDNGSHVTGHHIDALFTSSAYTDKQGLWVYVGAIGTWQGVNAFFKVQ